MLFSKKWSAILLVVAFPLFLAQYQSADALSAIQKQYHQQLDALATKIQNYQQAATALNSEAVNIQQLQKAHREARLAYKQVEIFVSYFDAMSAKKFMNGAPLPTLEPNVPEIKVIEPSGLQFLDELVYSEDVLAEKATIEEQIALLLYNYESVHIYQKNIEIQHHHIFSALQESIVSLFTLGLTGFDTPGSVQALPEATVSLMTIQELLGRYMPLIESKSPQLSAALGQTFNQGFQQLSQQTDFNTFDRLAFLRNCVNPLYRQIYEARQLLNIEDSNEIETLPDAYSSAASHIFSDDFLNPGFYANLPEEAFNEKRVELGRLLFFDPILSANNLRSCASCHHPDKAFTDGLEKSLALDNEGHILRNAPTVINAVYAERYFYDLREPELERQVKHVFLDSMEFGTSFIEAVEKISQSTEYQDLFAEAYADQGDYQLSKWSISNALTSYVISLRSFNSPFDQYARGEAVPMSASAKNGFNLFMGKAACGTCHFAPSFSGLVPPRYQESESEVLGVPIKADTIDLVLDPDRGRYASYRPQDQAYFYEFSFKTPTIRNIALTAPYMHNGAYPDLHSVVDFYNRGGGAGMGLDLPHQTLPFAKLDLSAGEIGDIVAFMETLTDTTNMTSIPAKLPVFEHQPTWNDRPIGGAY